MPIARPEDIADDTGPTRIARPEDIVGHVQVPQETRIARPEDIADSPQITTLPNGNKLAKFDEIVDNTPEQEYNVGVSNTTAQVPATPLAIENQPSVLSRPSGATENVMNLLGVGGLLAIPQQAMFTAFNKLTGKNKQPGEILLGPRKMVTENKAIEVMNPQDVAMHRMSGPEGIAMTKEQVPEKEPFLKEAYRFAESVGSDPLVFGPALVRAVTKVAGANELTRAGLSRLREDLPPNMADLSAEQQFTVLSKTIEDLKGSPNAPDFFYKPGVNVEAFGKTANVIPQRTINRVIDNPIVNPIRKLYNKFFGGRYGEKLGVTAPEAKKTFDTMEQKTAGIEAKTGEEVANLYKMRESLPPEKAAQVEDVARNPEKLGLEKPFEQIVTSKEPTDISAFNRIMDQVEQKIHDEFTARRVTAQRKMEDVLKDFEGVSGRNISDTARSTITNWLGGKVSAADVPDSVLGLFNDPVFVDLKNIYNKRAQIQEARKGMGYLQNPEATAARMEKLQTKQMENPQYSEFAGKAVQSVERRKQMANDFIDATSGREPAKTAMLDNDVREWVKDNTKITAEVVLDPVQREYYTKYREGVDEMLKHAKDMNPNTNLSERDVLPRVEKGKEFERFRAKPRLTNMSPGGGMTIDPETGRVASITELNKVREARGQDPLASDLETLYGVGLKDARQQKMVMDESRKLADKIGVPLDPGDFQAMIDNPKIAEAKAAPGYAVFNRNELKHLPNNFQNRQFPIDMVDQYRRGLEAGQKGLFAKGGVAEHMDAYMNAYRSWALATPKYVIRNFPDDSWRRYLKGVDLKSYGKAATVLNNPEGIIETQQGLKIKHDDLRRMMQEDDVFSGFTSGEAPGMEGTNIFKRKEEPAKGIGKVGEVISKVAGAESPIPTGFRKISASLEGFGRATQWLDEFIKTSDRAKARAAVSEVNFDYKDISPAIQRSRSVLLFPTFFTKNVPFQVKMLATRPDKFALLNHSYTFLNNLDPNEDLTDQVKANWPFKSKDGKYLYQGGRWLSSGDLEKVIQPLARMWKGERAIDVGRDIGMDVASQGVPFVIAALEVGFNKSFGMGYGLERYDRSKTDFLGFPVEQRYEPLFSKALPAVSQLYQQGKNLSRKRESAFTDAEPPRSTGQRVIDTLLQRGQYNDPNKQMTGDYFNARTKKKEARKAITDELLGNQVDSEYNLGELDKAIEKLKSGNPVEFEKQMRFIRTRK